MNKLKTKQTSIKKLKAKIKIIIMKVKIFNNKDDKAKRDLDNFFSIPKMIIVCDLFALVAVSLLARCQQCSLRNMLSLLIK